MNCPLCGKKGNKIFKGNLLNRFLVQYFQCSNCGLIFTETPYWLDEAYKDSITGIDTGIMSRNVRNVFCTNILSDRVFDKKGTFLDYGGGYGVFTRMMRDIGYNWKWQDKYSPNLFARGFEYTGKENIELITAFELFEHFAEPKKELDNLFGICNNILFSTLLYDRNMKYKPFSNWWYYVPETGQHISFYSERTCHYIAKLYDVSYYHLCDDLHLFTSKKIKDEFIKFFFNSRYCWALQSYLYNKNSKNSRSSGDMKKMIHSLKTTKM